MRRCIERPGTYSACGDAVSSRKWCTLEVMVESMRARPKPCGCVGSDDSRRPKPRNPLRLCVSALPFSCWGSHEPDGRHYPLPTSRAHFRAANGPTAIPTQIGTNNAIASPFTWLHHGNT